MILDLFLIFENNGILLLFRNDQKRGRNGSRGQRRRTWWNGLRAAVEIKNKATFIISFLLQLIQQAEARKVRAINISTHAVT